MNPRKNVQKKINDAIIEGKLIRRTGMYAVKAWRRAWEIVDFAISDFARKKYMDRIEVKPGKIMFMTFQGDYTCNPKYITEELARESINCEIVWAVRKASLQKSYEFPDGVRIVEQYTPEYYDELASAQIWVFNSVEMFKRKFYKKQRQFFIETWHGSLGIKRFDADVNAGKAWVNAAWHAASITDFCISNSAFEDDVYRESFWHDSEILRIGHPRNDVLLREDLALYAREKVKRELQLEEGVKYVLYAPTFRDDHQFNNYINDYHRICAAFEQRFGGTWKIMVRFHPTVRKMAEQRGRLDNCVNATAYSDIQEVMAVADAAITDYSSWIYDFVLAGKPGFLYVPDLDEYYTERGFYYSLEETPFPVCRNMDSLDDAISDFDEGAYLDNVRCFIDGKGCIDDGHASERVVKLIASIIAENKSDS